MVDKELLHIIKVDLQTYIGNHLLFLFNHNNIRHSTPVASKARQTKSVCVSTF